MILPLIGAVGKTVLGAGKKVTKGIKERAKKIDPDKFMNKKKERKTYSRPIPTISNTNISLSSDLSSKDVPESTEVKDIVGDINNVVGDIKSIIEKDLQLDRLEDKDKKTSIRNMFARAREKFLEKLPKPVRPKLKALKNISALQKIQKFIRTVLIGSLLTFLYENMDVILQWIKGFIDVVTPVVKWIVKIGKGLVNMAMKIPPFFMENKDLGEDKVDELSKNYEGIEDEANKIKGEWERWEPEEPGQENGPTETSKETPKETPKEDSKETSIDTQKESSNNLLKTKEIDSKTNKTVTNRFDIETGKAFINDKEVDIDAYKEFMDLSKEERLEKHGIDVQKMNKGGVVPGSGNTDTVPAMLTPGEFVMSKGAVQKYGEDTLAAMNSMGGGTNKPTIMRGYNEGGAATPMSSEDLVAAVGPSLKIFMEQHNALIDSDPEFYGTHSKIEMDRDGKMPNFGKTIANMGEWAFNKSVETIQNNEAIEQEVKEAILKKMLWIRKETLDNPNFKSDLAFDINKDIPGTAAHRLFLKAQADTTSPAATGGISARDRALLMNRRGMSGGGLVKPYDFAKENNLEIEDIGDGINRMVTITNPAFKYKYGKLKGRNPSLTAHGTYKQEDKISTEDFINNYRFREEQDLLFNTKKLNNMLTDFSKSKLERGIDGLLSNIGNLFNRSGDVDNEKSSSTGILGPISSNIDDMVDTKEYKPLGNISTYEEDFESEINVPITIPKPSVPSPPEIVPTIVPIGASGKTILNRYYKEQLLAFLYKV